MKIPDMVTRIDDSAYSNCSRLTTVTTPDSVTTIGAYAFDGCRGLMSVTIPDRVRKLATMLSVVARSSPSWCSLPRLMGLTAILFLAMAPFMGAGAFAIAPPHLRESLRRHFYDSPLLLQLEADMEPAVLASTDAPVVLRIAAEVDCRARASGAASGSTEVPTAPPADRDVAGDS